MKTKTLEMPAVIGDFLSPRLNAQMLRYAAGTAIQCPACGDILDWRRTVVATIHGVPVGQTSEVVIKAYTQCGKCYDKNAAMLADGIAKSQTRLPQCKIRLEVIDGRSQEFSDID